ncbi:hypothetical protein Ocin01_08071 [Orchesella cincta]|uniref:Uncharacterized protein n=1 Tax=Orchesella cincta TaxID=48709 RepID=A0A1D2N081_ORCCI|nr:hypothetical protein Ocin01_08071 [Orchesella cincta]
MKKSKLLVKTMAPVGVVVAVFVTLCVVTVSSFDARKLVEAMSDNQTAFTHLNANVTGQLMKRAGQFANQFASRALWMRKGKLVFPAGTLLSVAPKVTVPAFRRKAFNGGLNSDLQFAWYLYLNLDKMGYTYDMHPFPFDRPPFYPFGSLMRPIESKDYGGDKKKEEKPEKGTEHNTHGHGPPLMMPPSKFEDEDYKGFKNDGGTKVYTYVPINKRTGSEHKTLNRKPRSIMSLPPPEKHLGGERAVLLPSIESMMANFGFEGRGCMLRAICEIHEFPLQEGYGLLGEMIALFFSVSQSPYAESHMPEYLKAEEAGRAGSCREYKQLCAKSLFKWETTRKQQEQDDLETNELPTSLLRSKYQDDEL